MLINYVIVIVLIEFDHERTRESRFVESFEVFARFSRHKSWQTSSSIVGESSIEREDEVVAEDFDTPKNSDTMLRFKS